MRLTKTVAFRLFLVLAFLQIAIFALLTYATVNVQQSQLMENVILSASRVSDVIARSMRYGMMLNRKEDIHNIIASIGGEPGIEGIRIYNKQGEIIFGTIPADLHTAVDMNAEACVICHSTAGLETPTSPHDRLSRIFSNPNGERVLGLITPIRNEAQCANGVCHAHPATKTILGVLDVKMSLGQVDRRLTESRNQLILLSTIAVLFTSLASGIFIWFVVRRPVSKLMAGMDLVAAGHLDHRLEAGSRDELGQLARTFNDMTEDLSRAKHELTSWSATLEQKVKEKTADVERVHKNMIRVEKMASLGNLASTVAHELNNPLEGILTFARLIMKRIRKLDIPETTTQTILDELRLVADEAQRSGNIVKNLLAFSRQRGSAFHTTGLQPILDRCVLLMNHHAEMQNVRIEASCTVAEGIDCDPNQIQQMLIALMVNAVEAMSANEMSRPSDEGLLRVSIAPVPGNETVELVVSDTGSGMDEETKVNIFEPFYTTKSEGKGVGLGLAVVYGIVQRHNGSIEVESKVGRGTVFTVTLPKKQPGDAGQADQRQRKEFTHE
jgi:two-component system, NtrC family, sensor kinase